MEYHSEAFSDGIDCWLHLGITKAFWYDNDDYTDFTLPELIEELHLVEES
jgi:hypothetical protein